MLFRINRKPYEFPASWYLEDWRPIIVETPRLDALLHSYRMKVRELALRGYAERVYRRHYYGLEISIRQAAGLIALRARELFDGE